MEGKDTGRTSQIIIDDFAIERTIIAIPLVILLTNLLVTF